MLSLEGKRVEEKGAVQFLWQKYHAAARFLYIKDWENISCLGLFCISTQSQLALLINKKRIY